MNTSNFFPNETATSPRGRTSKPRRGFLGPEMPANEDVGDGKSTQDIWGDISMFQDDGASWIVPPFLGRRVNSSRLPLPPFTQPPFVPAAQPHEYADHSINPQGARDIEDSSDDEIVWPTTVHGGMDGPAAGSGPCFGSPSPRPDSSTASVLDSASPRSQTPPMTPTHSTPLGQPFLRPDSATNAAVHLADTCLRVVQVMFHVSSVLPPSPFFTESISFYSCSTSMPPSPGLSSSTAPQNPGSSASTTPTKAPPHSQPCSPR